MKYVLWGMGQNGLELYSILPSDDILLLIDREKENSFFGELKHDVVSLDEYLELYRSFPEHLIIICPFDYREMEKLLLLKRITNYTILKKSKTGMLVYQAVVDGLYAKQLKLDIKKTYCIFRSGFFQELLFERMLEDGYHVEWTKERSAQSGELEEDHINRVFYNDYNYKLSVLKRSLEDETVFIIGNGPSLSSKDLDILNSHGCITMAVNDIFHIFEHTKWRPDYYFISDRVQLKEYMEGKGIFNAAQSSVRVFSDNCVQLMLRDKNVENTFFFRQIQDYENLGFSRDCRHGVYCSNTVIYAALQFAAFMGVKTIYLLGCDNGFPIGGKIHFYEETRLYYNLHKLEEESLRYHKDMERGYIIAKEELQSRSIDVFNATRGGYLEVFERVDFDRLF